MKETSKEKKKKVEITFYIFINFNLFTRLQSNENQIPGGDTYSSPLE